MVVLDTHPQTVTTPRRWPPPDGDHPLTGEIEVLHASQVILNVQQSLGTVALSSTCTLD